MFASKTLLEHLLRGLLGGAAVFWGMTQGNEWLALAALPVALIAFRGCPTCWLMGLAETVSAKMAGRRPLKGACRDGSCASER